MTFAVFGDLGRWLLQFLGTWVDDFCSFWGWVDDFCSFLRFLRTSTFSLRTLAISKIWPRNQGGGWWLLQFEGGGWWLLSVLITNLVIFLWMMNTHQFSHTIESVVPRRKKFDGEHHPRIWALNIHYERSESHIQQFVGGYERLKL